MKKVFNNKKGNVADLPLIPIVIFIMGVFIVSAYMVSDQIRDGVNARITNTESVTNIDKANDALLNFDYVFVITTAGLILTTVVSAFFIRSHPIFFGVSSLLMFIFMIPSVLLSNAFERFEAQSQVADIMSNFTLISYFLDKLPWIFAVTAVLVFIVLFLKRGDSGVNYYG